LTQNPQKRHYETIHEDYGAHYYDRTSMAYRRRFLFGDLCKGLDLNGMRVADLACGSGHNSLILKEMFPDVRLHGFDLSAKACAEYQALVGAEATECDLLKQIPTSEPFDVAMIVGGLHHCISDLDAALANCAQLVKPGGVFLAIEPNESYVLNQVRKLWYRHDRWFEAATEAPLDIDDLVHRVEGKMTLEFCRFLGGPAYFIILNSLVLRIPVGFKQKLAGPLFAVESAFNRLPGRWLFPAFVSRWRRL
jgi:SAM-dependent methyltransferase